MDLRFFVLAGFRSDFLFSADSAGMQLELVLISSCKCVCMCVCSRGAFDKLNQTLSAYSFVCARMCMCMRADLGDGSAISCAGGIDYKCVCLRMRSACKKSV